jgi:hypothetical protein
MRGARCRESERPSPRPPGSTPAAPGTSPGSFRPGRRPDVAIRGPLRELGIHDVFQLLDLSRKTGILKVTSELRQNEGTIWFENGAVVAASIHSNPHRIGELLFTRQDPGSHWPGACSRTAIFAAGEILSDQRLAARLEHLVRAQVEEVVFTVLSWSEGWFQFDEGPASDIPARPTSASRPGLLMEGAAHRRMVRIQSRICRRGATAGRAHLRGAGLAHLDAIRVAGARRMRRCPRCPCHRAQPRRERFRRGANALRARIGGCYCPARSGQHPGRGGPATGSGGAAEPGGEFPPARRSGGRAPSRRRSP